MNRRPLSGCLTCLNYLEAEDVVVESSGYRLLQRPRTFRSNSPRKEAPLTANKETVDDVAPTKAASEHLGFIISPLAGIVSHEKHRWTAGTMGDSDFRLPRRSRSSQKYKNTLLKAFWHVDLDVSRFQGSKQTGTAVSSAAVHTAKGVNSTSWPRIQYQNDNM